MRAIKTKSAFIAVVGKPNVGKSSLVNALVGEKIAIVSFRPQTTRTRITGILTEGETQLVLMDTPGLLQAKNRLGDAMVKTVHKSVADVDAALLVVEPQGDVKQAELELIRRFQRFRRPAVLAINKIDLLSDKTRLMGRIAQYAALYDFQAIVPVCAKTGDGVDRLLCELRALATPGVHFFPDDAVTDQPERLLAAEMVREKLLWYLKDEIPHGTAVITQEMKEKKGVLYLSCLIYCDRENHKGIIIGKGGAMLKKIATSARLSMEAFFGCRVHLTCWVKVKAGWRNREELLRSMGFSDWH